MIIDAHTHIISSFSNPNIVDIKFDWSDLDFWLSSEPRSKCIIMPAITQFCDSVSLNKEFINTWKTFSRKDRVLPFMWIHPNQLEASHFKELGFSGFKFHPSISQSTIDDNEKILELCEKNRKPILIHCGRNEKSRIDYVLKINENYPNLNFICAHLGGLATDLIIRAFQKMLEAKYLDNIFLDTAGCFYPELVKKAVKILGSNKVVFGTDRPFHDYDVSLYTIRRCNFDKETEKDMLFRNLLRILHH
ncbi:MAG: amidohydrolase family protein [Candidatus Bathyarchaeota archaeon]|nr:amidohydrolase family protein [Candidatus Bathyarchaeota archaeon]MDH5745852.1 amidohydrolase family protein [Candidatus Bathyarchaeota archaeon]